MSIDQHNAINLLPILIERDLEDPIAIDSLFQQAINLKVEHKPKCNDIRLKGKK